MAITDPFVLPQDVAIIEITKLPKTIRKQFTWDEGDYYISRPQARVTSQIINTDAAELLKLFNEPLTIIQAILNYSNAKQTNPEQLLEEAYPVVQHLISLGLLVAPDSPEASAIKPLLEIGDHVGDCEVIRCLQVTEDSEIYEVKDSQEQSAALKILRPGIQTMARHLFENEENVLKRLSGSVNPKLLKNGVLEDRPWLLIEWCEGEDSLLKAHNLQNEGDSNQWYGICGSILNAFASLHVEGVVHSDIHPRNVLILPDGEVKVIDYGLARFINTEENNSVPRGGMPFFYEPEYAQAVLENKQPLASSFLGEQYAIAALVHLLLTGKHYYEFSLERQDMLRQIMEEPPLIPTSIAPPFRSILSRALHKDPRQRFSSMTEFAALWQKAMIEVATYTLTESNSINSNSADFLDRILQHLSLKGGLLPNGIAVAPTASINYGAAGVAYALLRIACARDDAELLTLAEVWITKAYRDLHKKEGFINDEMEISAEIVGQISLFHSPAGVHFVQACISQTLGDFDGQQRAIDSFITASKLPCENPDVTLGRAGTLLACSLLLNQMKENKYLNLKQLIDIGESTNKDLQALMNLNPVIGESESISYLGMAHGWAGLLYTAMCWSGVNDAEPSDLVIDRLNQLANLAEPLGKGARWKWMINKNNHNMNGGYMPGWCNGSAGYVFLWTLAYKLLRKEHYLTLAQQAAWDTYTSRSQVGNLCCGFAGQAYSLINLYKCTGDKDWLLRAYELTNLATAAMEAHPTASPLLKEMPEHSLYKGSTGIAVLIAELSHPDRACCPVFELNI